MMATLRRHDLTSCVELDVLLQNNLVRVVADHAVVKCVAHFLNQRPVRAERSEGLGQACGVPGPNKQSVYSIADQISRPWNVARNNRSPDATCF